jgi:hypothetical protein
MPLQNRIDPYGRLVAVEARGAWMGNRGILHDAERRIVAAWRSPRWITCSLEFRGRRRRVFSSNRYTELFFLDEATALAAGHRPCAECRRARYREFRAAWAAAGLPGADEIDRVLHSERVQPGGSKKTYEAPLSSLPGGVIVEHEHRPHLVWTGKLFPWSFAGYGPVKVSPATRVSVLTPKSIVRAIRRGFVPQVDRSAVG